MASLTDLAHERTDLSDADIERLHALVAEWTLISDVAFSDLVLWLPTWNGGGFVAAAQVRPTTAQTAVPEDLVGTFTARARRAELDMAAAIGKIVSARDAENPLMPKGIEAFPVTFGGRVIAVIARHASVSTRNEGRLEEVYLTTADDLMAMVADGEFPPTRIDDPSEPPRVGDGIVRLDVDGIVTYASPNAVSAYRRLGLATDLIGADLARVSRRLEHRPGPVDESLGLIAAGRAAGGAEVENQGASVSLRALPLSRAGHPIGAVVLVRDMTELRRRDRALLSRDATIREIHHRVKNNLQTVAALLRLQARRLDDPAGREALAEAVRRIGSIAVVHETLAHNAAHRGRDGAQVDFDDVAGRIVALAADLAAAHRVGGVTAELSREGECGSLMVEVATPLAMALSELLSNAVEHAQARHVGLTCVRTDRELTLRVEDDGRGLPEGFTIDQAEGLGMQIVRGLIGELRGEMEFADASPSGTIVEVRVPLT